MNARASYPTLRNAPITEAVIDLRVAAALPFTPDLLQRYRDQFVSAFPQIEEQRRVEALFESVEGGPVRQSMSDYGVKRLVMRSDDRNEAVMVSDTGFAFSKLRPYTDWPHVFTAAKEFWLRYADVAKVEGLARLAVRYINHFPVSRGSSLSDFLEAPPELPKTVTLGEVQSVFRRLALRDIRTDIETVVVQAITLGADEATVVLDIDASLSGSFPANEEMWTYFEELRAAKNRIFFGSITPHAEEEFNR